MNLTALVIIGFLAISPLFGQNALTPVRCAKSASLGFTGATFQGPESIYHNPAGLIFAKEFTVLISSEQRFLVEDMNASSISLTKKWDANSAFGLYLGSFGLKELKEQKIAITYSRRLSESISIGTHFDYIRFSIDEYGSTGRISFGLGIQNQLSQQIKLGFHITNPAKIQITDHSNLDNYMALGINYSPSDKISILAEISKILDRNEQIHIGLDYRIMDRLSLRFGSRSSPAIFSFGIGYRFSDIFYMNGGFSQHPYLGYTPSLSLGYER